MKTLRYLTFFGLILVLSTVISFVGYRYLALANNYREANFTHLDAVHNAINLIRTEVVPNESSIRRLHALNDRAEAQADWCINNLNMLDRAVFRMLGAKPALEICRQSFVHTSSIRYQLNGIDIRRSQFNDPFNVYYLLHNEVFPEIEHLRKLSVSFQPHVTRIQYQMEWMVRMGTAVASTVLLILSLLGSRQLIRAQKRIEEQSLTDPLTQLRNRRALDEEIARPRSRGPAVLARIDLDRFKQVNDILGHDAGDAVLCHVADLMRKNAQPGDILARVGGDEFVIFFAEGTSQKFARAVIERILEAVAEPLLFGDKKCNFGASFGMASTDVDGLAQADLLNAADTALYEVKRAGRGSVAHYSDLMHAAALRDRALADRFRDALAAHEIVPYFQSQHLARDWSLFGVEVLARWEHPEEGVLTPDQFLGIAHQLGLEAELDRVIFEQTVALRRDMAADGLEIPRIAFNVSAGRITSPSFIAEIREQIPTEREKFAFEILESVYYEDANEALTFAIDAIKDMGFLVDVDDFGSGHASINSVLNISPHLLKIDRKIVQPIDISKQALRMTASIVELANALDMQVIAEGVDSAEKARLLHEMGCHALQGFYFSTPMSIAQLRDFLDNKTWTTLAS